MVKFFHITEAEILNKIDFCNQYKYNIKPETNFMRFINARNLLILVISILLFLICLLTFFNILPKNDLDKEDNYEKLDINDSIFKNSNINISIKNINNYSFFLTHIIS